MEWRPLPFWHKTPATALGPAWGLRALRRSYSNQVPSRWHNCLSTCHPPIHLLRGTLVVVL
eukprot:1929399-Lingulodinium_polyedra.AAC.1